MLIFLPSRLLSADKADMILIEKSQRSLKLIKNGNIIKTYPINLGFDPIGHKFYEGDGKTPEGLYYISQKVINSAFYISFKISYPNKWDKINAKEINKNPGGYIMIHGHPKNSKKFTKDWTNGCIALSNKNINELSKRINIKTPVLILK
mgnify:CR=1 FL=1